MKQTTAIIRPLLNSLGVDETLNRRNMAVLQMITLRIIDAQIVTLQKAAKYERNLSKIVFSHNTENLAIALSAKDCAAWVYPDGKLERAKHGQSTAYLNRNWTQSL